MTVKLLLVMEPESFSDDLLLVDPQKLFNNQKTVADLWNLKADGILTFFDDINKDPQKYGITNDAVKKELPTVITTIKTIVQAKKGPIFLPTQMKLPFLGISQPIEVKTLYDLVGWVFSVSAGKPEKTPDRNNYYFPVICVYCVFCRRLTEIFTAPSAQSLDLLDAAPLDYDPTMTQITWFKNPEDDAIYLCLSANLDCGTEASRKKYKKNKSDKRRERALQLQAIGILPKTVDPNARPKGGTNLYGMCAETVPFLFVKAVMDKKTTKPFDKTLVGGLAVQGFNFLPEQAGQPVMAYNADTIKATGACRKPCDTCELLIINYLVFSLANFRNLF